jgi:hypothetical protein
MKFALVLTSLLLSQIAFSQSAKEKKNKQAMLERVELLIEKVEGTREDLKTEDVVKACEKIKEMFLIYPDHLKDIGSHLDLYRGRTVRAKDQALDQLIFMHRQSLICSKGKNSEYVNPEKLSKELKGIESSLKKQRKVILKSDADNENFFSYEYEF